jgi:hypothetical protein
MNSPSAAAEQRSSLKAVVLTKQQEEHEAFKNRYVCTCVRAEETTRSNIRDSFVGSVKEGLEHLVSPPFFSPRTHFIREEKSTRVSFFVCVCVKKILRRERFWKGSQSDGFFGFSTFRSYLYTHN